MNPDCKAALKEIAMTFLAGQQRPLETALALSSFEDDVPESLRDALTAMVAVASQTDDVPLGAGRKLWHPDVRAREDQKHDAAQAWAEPIVRETCEMLVELL